MGDIDRFSVLLTRTGIGYPRGILGEDARFLAWAAATGDGAPHDDRRRAAAELHWDALRGAMGAAFRRARAQGDDDPALEDAARLTEEENPDNPLSWALVDDAVHQLAAVLARSDERLEVLDQRLEDDSAEGDVARTVGDIVSDLLDLDVEDYEDEIAAYVRDGESDASRAELARTTGDAEMREWARSELAWVTEASDTTSGRALAAMARGPLPDDPADDPVWMSTILALVEEAVEIVQVDELSGYPETSSNGSGDDWLIEDPED